MRCATQNALMGKNVQNICSSPDHDVSRAGGAAPQGGRNTRSWHSAPVWNWFCARVGGGEPGAGAGNSGVGRRRCRARECQWICSGGHVRREPLGTLAPSRQHLSLEHHSVNGVNAFRTPSDTSDTSVTKLPRLACALSLTLDTGGGPPSETSGS